MPRSRPSCPASLPPDGRRCMIGVPIPCDERVANRPRPSTGRREDYDDPLRSHRVGDFADPIDLGARCPRPVGLWRLGFWRLGRLQPPRVPRSRAPAITRWAPACTTSTPPRPAASMPRRRCSGTTTWRRSPTNPPRSTRRGCIASSPGTRGSTTPISSGCAITRARSRSRTARRSTSPSMTSAIPSWAARPCGRPGPRSRRA